MVQLLADSGDTTLQLVPSIGIKKSLYTFYKLLGCIEQPLIIRTGVFFSYKGELRLLNFRGGCMYKYTYTCYTYNTYLSYHIHTSLGNRVCFGVEDLMGLHQLPVRNGIHHHQGCTRPRSCSPPASIGYPALPKKGA